MYDWLDWEVELKDEIQVEKSDFISIFPPLNFLIKNLGMYDLISDFFIKGLRG